MRPVLFTLVALGGLPAGRQPEKPADPWEGTYLKHAEHGYGGADHQGWWRVPQITITKTADGYSLGKAYPEFVFTEVKPGVLKSGLGLLTRGTVEYADGRTARVLRAEFCYESFVLYDRADRPLPGVRR